LEADLVLVGRVWTCDPRRPRAEAVAIRGDRIAAVGTQAEVRRWIGPRTEVFDPPDGAIVPGFVDAHVHFGAIARRALDVDCSRERAGTIGQLLARIGDRAATLPAGCWIRAYGYDESLVAEHRAPTPADLDRVAPRHPVRLLHRTGHAAVLNGAAFRALGMEPREAIFEPASLLRGRIPKPGAATLRALAERASEALASAGVTTFHDVTPGQSPTDLETLRDWAQAGVVRQRVAAYAESVQTVIDSRRTRDERFGVPGVKIMVTEDTSAADVAAAVAAADRAGAQVALHAVEGGPLAIAVAALGAIGATAVRAHRHRIEHASLCPPPLCAELAACGATVVTHPQFLTRFGAKYRAEIRPEEHEWLYPLRAFGTVGVRVALGSDAPIAPSEPLANIAAAASRADGRGIPIGPGQAIAVSEALAMHTRHGAELTGSGDRFGVLREGHLADALVLDRDPSAAPPRDVAAIGVRMTIVGGEIAWRRP
jgi:predicted amidohydrolase YtcJ